MLILAIWGDRPVMKTVDEPRGSQVLQVISRASCLGLEIGLNRPDNPVTISGSYRQYRPFAREAVNLRRARPWRIKRQRCTGKSHGKEGQNSCSQHALNIARFYLPATTALPHRCQAYLGPISLHRRRQ